MRLAVLMSSYNGEKFIARQLDSILAQEGDFSLDIIVRDDGMGLPESEVSRIFDAHYRGSNTTPGSGSGYGLFLVKQAVEAQGGSVTAASRPGRGMSVTFTLPLVQTEG